ncbi:hypothetical protein LBMAG49_15460 [Planctomycetota bacterium]|nr:hypothetical protein LBMAG49_15460 [Planctomycetota bacterium]
MWKKCLNCRPAVWHQNKAHTNQITCRRALESLCPDPYTMQAREHCEASNAASENGDAIRTEINLSALTGAARAGPLCRQT